MARALRSALSSRVPQPRGKRPSLVVKGLALDSPTRAGLHCLLRSRLGSALIARPQSKKPMMDDDDKRRARKQELANLGRAFREAREQSGLSEREVADAVRGVSLAGVRAIEAGERPASTTGR